MREGLQGWPKPGTHWPALKPGLVPAPGGHGGAGGQPGGGGSASAQLSESELRTLIGLCEKSGDGEAASRHKSALDKLLRTSTPAP
eukprot:8109443-Pyramimonas_sp.AAC.1